MGIRVAAAAISGRIFAGRISKDGTRFVGEKIDVTSDVWKAVVDVIEPGHAMTITADGKPRYEIAVRNIQAASDTGDNNRSLDLSGVSTE